MLESASWQEREPDKESRQVSRRRGLPAKLSEPRSIISLLVYLFIAAYIAFFAWLSILRHQTLQSNAMDLGYTDQVVWNTLHGRVMRFSTLQGVSIDLPLDQFRRTDILLAYHVEPILVPISLLYLIYASPVTLLVVQTVALGSGALPAFWLARSHLESNFAGLVFALAYLLSPAVEGANLSDFHAVSLTPALLLFGLFFLLRRRYGPFLLSMTLAMATKEDVSLLVAMVGLYIIFRLRETRMGVVTTLMGLGWFLTCTQIILPYFSGLPVSPFFHRLAIFGPSVKESLINLLRNPLLLVRWLVQPEVLTYLMGLLSTTGFMSLFGPLILGLAAPVVAINVFSSWSWTYSEGAHYSASIVPFLILSGIYGVGFLSRRVSQQWGILPERILIGLALLVLLVGLCHHYRVGVSPVAQTFYPPRITQRHRLAQEFTALIPPDASLSAQSGLYPHVAHREKAYFFPAINDADYIFLDAAGSSYPLTVEQLYTQTQRLLDSQEFSVVAAEDGYVLMQRGQAAESTPGLPPEFYSFVLLEGEPSGHAVKASFGDVLELVGYDYSLLNAVNAHELPATVITYWRPLRPTDVDYGFAFFFTRRDGAIVGEYTGGTAASLWYPSSVWQEEDIVRIETPVLPVGRLQDVLVAVIIPGGDPWSVDGRVHLVSAAGAGDVELLEEDSLLRLFCFSEARR